MSKDKTIVNYEMFRKMYNFFRTSEKNNYKTFHESVLNLRDVKYDSPRDYYASDLYLGTGDDFELWRGYTEAHSEISQELFYELKELCESSEPGVETFVSFLEIVARHNEISSHKLVSCLNDEELYEMNNILIEPAISWIYYEKFATDGWRRMSRRASVEFWKNFRKKLKDYSNDWRIIKFFCFEKPERYYRRGEDVMVISNEGRMYIFDFVK